MQELLQHIQHISRTLSSTLERPSIKPLLKDAIPFSVSNFKQIVPAQGRVSFVDGGNCELLGGPHFSLQFCRIAHVTYEENKLIDSSREEFFILVETVQDLGDIGFETRLFGKEMDIPLFSASDPFLTRKDKRASPTTVAGLVRRLCEIYKANTLSGKVVLDGNLQAEHPVVRKHLTGALYAVSKTCEVYTDTGDALGVALQKLSPYDSFAYYPLAEHLQMSMVKLHPQSKYVFKVEGGIDIIPLLASHARDPAFLGYPYGLLQADKLARVTNEEQRYLKLRFTHLLGEEKITQHLNTLNAHDVLDTI